MQIFFFTSEDVVRLRNERSGYYELRIEPSGTPRKACSQVLSGSVAGLVGRRDLSRGRQLLSAIQSTAGRARQELLGPRTLTFERLVRIRHQVKVRVALMLLDPGLDLLQRLLLDGLVRRSVVHESGQGRGEGFAADLAVKWRSAIRDECTGELAAHSRISSSNELASMYRILIYSR